MARSADGYCAGAQSPDPRIKLEQRVRLTLTGKSVDDIEGDGIDQIYPPGSCEI